MEHFLLLKGIYDKIEKSLLSQLNDIIDNSSEDIKKDMLNEHSLLPKEQVFEIKKNELISLYQKVNAETSRFQDAIEVFSNCKERYLTISEMKQFDEEITKFSNKFLESLPLKDVPLTENTTIQSVLGISDYVLHCFYTVGYHLLEDKQYKLASNIFLMLSVLNPLVKDHWMALGMAEHEEKQYERALNAYAMACILDFQNPLPHFAAVNCYVALEDFDNADAELSLAQECIKNTDNPTEWAAYFESIDSELKRNKLKI